ncbi:hypothetical protein RHMOL_Rhmol03G0275500 [Rhododendron molle]|uniref:Uncharacterized protein n=1 Tax=Rhododendron molle TaxID=49168 RepID=A0ACC0PKT2_RHOML|nr:hypothetical protein RHMOL_Rhmol03G0275500 [Rhododendron molle]
MRKSSTPTTRNLNRTIRDKSPTNDEYNGGGSTVEELGRPKFWKVRVEDEDGK